MRRPWIKIETCTPDKPEICAIATQLKIDEDMVMGKLVRLWSWVTVNHVKSDDLSVTKEFIDKLVAKKGFAEAMIKAGWLLEKEERLVLPNFERHHSDAAKTRALTAVRVARHRAVKKVKEVGDVEGEKVTINTLTNERPVEPLVEIGLVTQSEVEDNEVVSTLVDPDAIDGGVVDAVKPAEPLEPVEEVGEEVAPISINAEPTFRPLHIDSPVAALEDVPVEILPEPESAPVPEPEPEAKADLPVKKGRKKQGSEETQAMLF